MGLILAFGVDPWIIDIRSAEVFNFESNASFSLLVHLAFQNFFISNFFLRILAQPTSWFSIIITCKPSTKSKVNVSIPKPVFCSKHFFSLSEYQLITITKRSPYSFQLMPVNEENFFDNKMVLVMTVLDTIHLCGKTRWVFLCKMKEIELMVWLIHLYEMAHDIGQIEFVVMRRQHYQISCCQTGGFWKSPWVY